MKERANKLRRQGLKNWDHKRHSKAHPSTGSSINEISSIRNRNKQIKHARNTVTETPKAQLNYI